MLSLKRRPKLSLPERLAASRYRMPETEAAWVREVYESAGVILEYGSGESTLVAAGLAGRTVFSVESDAAWTGDLSAWFREHPPAATVHLHHADIGPTGSWGKPTDPSCWPRFHRYPLSVWDRPDFAAPDTVLIDGRFRAACFVTVMLRITKPVTVLFDDYVDRPQFHHLAEYAEPSAPRGRMVRFDLEPRMLPRDRMTNLIETFAAAQ